MHRKSPFQLMKTVFAGLAISLTYGLLSAVLLYFLEGESEFRAFLIAYNNSFGTLLSFGLILGSALVVFISQNVIPGTIEAAFKDNREQLLRTDYALYKTRFVSRRRSITFSAEFIVAAFIIFTCCQFPLSGLAEALMIIPACAQYALGVYVGRKLLYAGMMLHSLLNVSVTRNLFKKRELDEINHSVNIASTLTIIFVYVHVLGYYEGPFLYRSIFGESIKIFLVMPALIAAPVLLIFNFYPRIVLRKIYSQSIDIEIKDLRENLQNAKLSPPPRKSCT